ncbi:hypothetical protein QPK24_16325 [Paenibacillus polygoni]|uniref:Nucleotidyl transferase AbiEii toxin, Type IV TA system n=1 Tax=Paenibacillus polygoni TaxID=3050112 RepID=A0ABY8WXW2_9BACL|nr:hypothetical protein [Paenibacillus polygoni]WIV17970.1 hypothetical protein QPK24_16325 [Paenibacillus polygoni]
MLDTALNVLGKAWNPKQYNWLLGGSCSLLLQGVELADPPNDIDVYADFETARPLHKEISSYSVDEQRLDRSGTYTSLLSHYQIGEASIELSGGFEICTSDSLYRTDIAFLIPHAKKYNIPGTHLSISMTPLSHELMFNILRERADRYELIAKKMKENIEAHTPLVKDLICRNVWSPAHLKQLEDVLGIDGNVLREQGRL